MKRTVRVRSVLSAFGVLLAGSAFAAFDWGTFTGTELVIPVGETVVAGNGQVETLNALTAITIPATSELKVSGTTTAVELSATVTGAGKLSFEADKLVSNVKAVLDAVQAARPTSVKGVFIKTLTLTSTMGIGVPCVLETAE